MLLSFPVSVVAPQAKSRSFALLRMTKPGERHPYLVLHGCVHAGPAFTHETTSITTNACHPEQSEGPAFRLRHPLVLATHADEHAVRVGTASGCDGWTLLGEA